jgi:hypothetical protein
MDPQSSTLGSTCQSLSNQPGAGSGRSRLIAAEMARKQTLGVCHADGRIAPEPTMDVSEVGEAVAHMANLPLSTNVLTMTIMATKDAVRRPGVAWGELPPNQSKENQINPRKKARIFLGFLWPIRGFSMSYDESK